MLRAVWLTIGKEFRLIRRDRVGLFMLLVAPIAVIAAAGFSLAKVYGGQNAPNGEYSVAVFDEDHGAIARAILDALAHQPDLAVLQASSRRDAEQTVRERKLAVVGIVIPAGTTNAIEHGVGAQLILYTDPVKYLQTIKVELALSELCRRITAGAAAQARTQTAEQTRNFTRQLDQARASAEQGRAEAARLATQADASRAAMEPKIRAHIETALTAARDQTRLALDTEMDRIQRKLDADTAARQAKLDELKDYLSRLEIAHGRFESWFGQLKELAGSHASEIPPPPEIPTLPADLNLGGINLAPVTDFRDARSRLENALTIPPIDLKLPELPPAPKIPLLNIPEVPAIDPNLAVPGTLGLTELDLAGRKIGEFAGFNAFDLQVPGFAVTFLLIGMLMGVSLALIDEHDWGTLERLRSASAPLWTTLTGKLLARFVVGFIQMAVLFAAGYVLFGISLGRTPAALIMPAAAIAFAGAAFGLIVAGVGKTRDAVLPVGAIVIMTMAAIGGCWWPIDFEPAWMQQVALALPTTWAMRAFNDLMIRDLAASSALIPAAVNFGFGIIYTVIGVAIARRRFG
ncbi:MAG: ABC transporter permease [Candidatus Binatus sp.]|jgi:ABC-type Na+ efflux pump permease subunit|uniref:ABC transporter permease n=1 Tax=Candidatus Binatus sp. TaxID=2811406 RepID=UPI003C738469